MESKQDEKHWFITWDESEAFLCELLFFWMFKNLKITSQRWWPGSRSLCLSGRRPSIPPHCLVCLRHLCFLTLHTPFPKINKYHSLFFFFYCVVPLWFFVVPLGRAVDPNKQKKPGPVNDCWCIYCSALKMWIGEVRKVNTVSWYLVGLDPTNRLSLWCFLFICNLRLFGFKEKY